MTDTRHLVLDANILMRAAFGRRVRTILDLYQLTTSFYTPAECFEDARTNVPAVAVARKADVSQSSLFLEELADVVEIVSPSFYDQHETSARARLPRDPDDWPIAAAALALNCPIWTEDQDFFGCGIATWTTATIELFLRDTPPTVL